MRLAGAAEVAQRQRDSGLADQFVGGQVEVLEGAGPVAEEGAEGARAHLLETQCQGAFRRTAAHGLVGQEQGAGTGGAVVVDVDHRDARHADFVERALAGSGVTVDVAHIGLLDLVVLHTGIGQRGAQGGSRHLGIGRIGAWLDEGDHANPDHIDVATHGAVPGLSCDKVRICGLNVMAASKPANVRAP
ncbi:hypothetical protein D3C78_1069230 [compost metagenome]